MTLIRALTKALIKPINSSLIRASEGSSDVSLQSVLSSTVADLDATLTASYPGTGQSWLNLVPAPADGSLKAGYDFVLGADSNASTDDPSFTGSAGSASAYFLCDGGDILTIAAGTNTSFINNMTKTTGGSDWWIAIAFRAIEGAAIQCVWSTQSTTTTVGHRMIVAANEALNYIQRQSTTNTSGTPSITAVTATDYLMIVSHSHAGNQTRWWVNSTTAVELSQDYTDGTADASGVLTVGNITPGGANPVNNTTRIYNFSMGNEYLDSTKAGLIFTHLEARHGRDYTP